MTFTLEPLLIDELVTGYRLCRDGEPWETYDAQDLRLAQSHRDALNRDFSGVARGEQQAEGA